MRSQSFIYIVVVIMAVFPATAMSLESPGGSNPLGLGTVPPTAYKSGLIPSINPVDSSGNMVITGNVTGGMQFRGIVPYSSVTDFSAPLDTLSHTSGGIDNFLKRTEGTPYSGQATGGLTPYYSPTQTVSRTIPGTGGLNTSQVVNSYNTQSYIGLNVQSGPAPQYQRRAAPQLLQRPLSMNPTDIERSIELGITKNPLGGEPNAEEQLQAQFFRQMGVQLTRRTEPTEEYSVTTRIGTREPNIGLLLGMGQGNKLNTLIPEAKLPQLGREGESRPDVYEQMRIEFGKPVKAIEVAGFQKEVNNVTTDVNQAATSKAGAAITGAGDILNTYKSFAAYTDDKFNKHIKAAEYYMKQGRFYRAADAYTIATVYKPDDPLGYAGKSIALFATGEYMSSALFLARAMEIFPEYPKVKVDLVAMIGDKDTVESRIAEALEWTQKNNSAELKFLLSYIYYQMDRLEFARQLIESAAKQTPDSQVILAMKKAIDERIGNQKDR